MCDSLQANHDDYHLHIFAFDDECHRVLVSMALPNTTVVSLGEFEDERLLAVKATRSRVEYCWTCTPSTILYVMERTGASRCTYIDADTYFFANPSMLLEELGGEPILITEHRYSPQHDRSATSGVYNVQFVTFSNTDDGLM